VDKPPAPSNAGRLWALHGGRVLVFCAVVLLIHLQHRERRRARRADAGPIRVEIDTLRRFYPEARRLAAAPSDDGRWKVLDARDAALGYVLQTSPEADQIIGFSGPTNVLLAFAPDDRLRGVAILSSGDTRDHVREVRGDERFLASFGGLSWEKAARPRDVDAVSGATLTSLAVAESIALRLGGEKASLRFPEPLTAEAVAPLFPEAASVAPDEAYPSLWRVLDAQGEPLGAVLRTSPAADNVVGYQGPTDTLIGLAPGGKIIGVALDKSYDNDPYVGYVREDWYFAEMFNGKTLDELAALDLEEAGVEGVSGATMTSMGSARGMVRAAKVHQQAVAAAAKAKERSQAAFVPSARDVGTGLVVLAGLVIGFTSLRGKKWIRLPFQLLLIGYLGLVNGDLLSQAMLVGWAQNGVPFQAAAGLALLTAAALATPIATKTNVYCSHLCPHGAAQQLLRNRLPWRLRLSRRASRGLSLVPGLLLVWVVVVALAALPFSLVDIEPFDAYVFRVAGWAALTIAVVGLIASLFVPMAYCRYGCPTGALLDFLRRHGRSDQFSPRDAVAVGCLLVALGLYVFL
jgi:Na+-translocating ferredoxin:NAD+ oxidoreductase RnfG subunit